MRLSVAVGLLAILSACGEEDQTTMPEAPNTANALRPQVQNAELPAGFSTYPGAQIVTSSRIEAADGSGTLVVMHSADSREDVIAFYREQAEAAGVVLANVEEINDTVLVLRGQGPDGIDFGVGASPGRDGGTEIQLTVGTTR